MPEQHQYTLAAELSEFKSLIQYLLRIISHRFSIHFTHVDSSNTALIHFSAVPDKGNYYCNPVLYSALLSGDFSSISQLRDMDSLAEAFYRLNCIQEYQIPVEQQDEYGRLKYEYAVQSKDNNAYQDRVSELFRHFLHQYSIPINNKQTTHRRVLLSHDIDILNGGIRSEVVNFFSRRSGMTLTDILRHFSGKKKVWNTIDDIIQIEKEYAANSIFYFLTERGIHQTIHHADYNLDEVSPALSLIRSSGSEIGLHKSAALSTYAKELSHLSPTTPLSNRNHYLRYRLPQDWQEMEHAGIRTDSGLGWSVRYGLRNSYPFPFHPFVQGRELNLLCIPLILMDTTFAKYFSPEEIVPAFQAMTESWKDGFTVSILFHNNYLSRGINQPFLNAYTDLLRFIRENGIEIINTAEIIESYQ